MRLYRRWLSLTGGISVITKTVDIEIILVGRPLSIHLRKAVKTVPCTVDLPPPIPTGNSSSTRAVRMSETFPTSVMMRKNTITRIMNGTTLTGSHQPTAKVVDVASFRIPGPDLVFIIYKKEMSSKYWCQLFLPTTSTTSCSAWRK